jgi:hypothetical protein
VDRNAEQARCYEQAVRAALDVPAAQLSQAETIHVVRNDRSDLREVFPAVLSALYARADHLLIRLRWTLAEPGHPRHR